MLAPWCGVLRVGLGRGRWGLHRASRWLVLVVVPRLLGLGAGPGATIEALDWGATTTTIRVLDRGAAPAPSTTTTIVVLPPRPGVHGAITGVPGGGVGAGATTRGACAREGGCPRINIIEFLYMSQGRSQ